MKKIFTLLLLLVVVKANAQYNNEWIDFSKTYYKFKVGATGLYRIPQSVIVNAGLGNTPAQYFQLFRNGQEIPIYTSVPSGPLGSNDYIEFWGEMNDGKPDKALYYNPAYQHTTRLSLETDTAVYFLTVNPATPTFHFSSVATDTTGNVLPVEPYFLHRTGTYFKQQINAGLADVNGEYLYSSSYDLGEFWSSGFIYPTSGGNPGLVDNQNNLYLYTGGPTTASLKFGAVGCADNARASFQTLVNNTVVSDQAMNNFGDLQTTVTLPLSQINSSSNAISFINNCPNPNDRTVVSFYELTYPRTFDFNNQTNFFFELPPKATGYYLQITDFNAQSTPPILYDLTNGVRYSLIAGNNSFYALLPSSASYRKLVMVSENSSSINTVTSLTSKNFTNFTNSANQGDYIIISNPLLYNTGSNPAVNPIVEYQQYRNSTAGGGYHSLIVDINELIDQFAFGIKAHPLSVMNFLSYARNNFATKPKYAFLIGHGITYDQFRSYENNQYVPYLEMIPTFGYPASDNKLAAIDVTSPVPVTPIGRLSVVTGVEVENYLQKVIEYEQSQQTMPNSVAGRGWMKNVVHVTGATDVLGTTLCNYMVGFQQVIQDTLFGGNVTLFCDASSTVASQIANQQLSQLFSTGFSILTYFGHSSSSTLAYNLSDPSTYNNQGKYPVFYINGCDAGNNFNFTPGRVLSSSKTLSENYVLAKERGSIAFVASTSWSLVNFLNLLIYGQYNLISSQDYGKSIGILHADAMQNLINIIPNNFDARIQAEQMAVHGDPALKLNTQTLPDYDVEQSQIGITPSFISVADTSFTINAHLWNLGKAVNDSVLVSITRTYPNGITAVLFQKRVAPIMTMDSILLSVPIVASRDQGQNYINITINGDNSIPEVTYTNNSTRVGIYVYINEARPIYPYDYSIVTIPNQKLFASTADPMAPLLNYVFQIDTTELFNSPLLVTKTISSIGGAIQFDPGISYKDSTVYYWRVSLAPAKQGDIYHWEDFSFIYLNNSSPGYNQSHFYQKTETQNQNIYLDSASRIWKFVNINNFLNIHNGVYPTAASQASDFLIAVNGNTDSVLNVCGVSSLLFNVFDPITFKPWINALNGQPGRFGSKAICGPDRIYNFQFFITTPADRDSVIKFMDQIPDGSYVVVRNIYGQKDSTIFASTFASDTTIYGSGNSVYNRLLDQGFTGIDTFNRLRAFIFTYQKNRQLSFVPQFVFSQGIYDQIFLNNSNYITLDTLGVVTSPKFGPALKWSQVHWNGYSLENPSTDSVKLDVIGTDTLGNSTLLYTLGLTNQDYDISTVNAKQYPYMQLRLTAKDNINTTPYQMNYWRINYTPVPEGAIAPNLYFNCPDTLQAGESLPFAVAFKNVSAAAFDSLALYMSILDNSNVTHVIPLPKKRPLISGDTLIVNYTLDTRNYQGANTLYIYVNPNYAQPEQFTFNNFLYKNFYVKSTKSSPTMDVTFDGVHILNQDIVSAKPHIVIKLTDNSKYLLLTDTSLVKIQVRYPDGSLHNFSFNSDTLKFTPATSGSNNVATVDFYPAFTNQYNSSGDVYTLFVTGRDALGNTTGAQPYEISFTVINKAMISNMLNYPNPFSTSTAFVFTITGSQVPQNIKIQILTITGKVVREITEDELGPLHVGTNITQFKWDGTNQYGQKLANGVYLYHVVTNLNGKSLDKYQSQNDNTDQYFNKGYGKMYLMR